MLLVQRKMLIMSTIVAGDEELPLALIRGRVWSSVKLLVEYVSHCLSARCLIFDVYMGLCLLMCASFVGRP